MTTQITSSILNSAIELSQELLTQYSLSDRLLGDLTTAFGSEYNNDVATDLITQWQTGNFDRFPQIEILSSTEINEANGAYSVDTNKIYISEEYLLTNANNVQAISDLLLEEYGHFVDRTINTVDSAGDEGAIFSRLVTGKSFAEGELQQLKAENDKAVVTLDGEEIAIEQQTDTGSDLFAFRIIGRDSGFTFGSGGFTSFDEFPRHLADIDGDGKADIVAFGENEVLTSLSNGDGTFGSIQIALDNNLTVNRGGWTSFDRFPRQLADINGDENADIVAFGKNLVFTALSKGDGTFENIRIASTAFNVNNGNWSSFDKFPRQVADINGDGNADIIGFGKDAVFTALSKGDGTFHRAQRVLNGFSVNHGFTSFDRFPRLLADVDGDENADIIGFAVGGVFTALSKGDGTFEEPQRVLNGFGVNHGFTSFNEFPRQVADVDGDGKADIIGFGEDSVFVSFSKGDGTFEQPQRALDALTVNKTFTSFDKYPRQVADVDGDGKADIVSFGFNRVTTSLSTSIRGTENSDTLTAPDNNNGYFIQGFASDDTLNGGDNDDTLEGGADNDILEGGAGNDILEGGAGNDTASFASAIQGFTVELDGANLSSAVGKNNDSDNKTLQNIENIIGSDFADTLRGDGRANRLEGGKDNDLLEGYNGNDILSGGKGDDILDGEDGRDRVIEQGDVNFTLFEFPLSDNNEHHLSGLGYDALIDIERVELTAGESNNILDASNANLEVKLKGLEGDDTLIGGLNDDTLIGGTGTNHLWGGEGSDTFVIDRSSDSRFSGDIQIIHDFDRTADTIDIAGADLRDISFERNSQDSDSANHFTLIKEKVDGNIVERAKVLGNALIDDSDLSAGRSIYPSISADKVGDLDFVIEEWAKNYAQRLGTNLVGDVSLFGVSLTQGEVKYSPFESIILPDDIQVNDDYINKGNSEQPGRTFTYTTHNSATSTVTESTSYSDTTTSAREHGWKIGVGYSLELESKFFGSGSKQTFSVSGEAYGNYSESGSFTNGGSTTHETVQEVGTSSSSTHTFTAPSNSVTSFKAISSQQKFTGDYEMDIAIGGDIEFILADDGDADNGINPIGQTVPVALILEQYNPEIFYSQDTSSETHELLDGTELVYSPNLEFTVTGTIESQSIYNTRTVLETTYDILLNGGQDYQGTNGKERFWVASGQLPLQGIESTIENFADGIDQIGFANVPEITGFDDLTLSQSGTIGIISYEDRTLAELVGIDATKLDASDFIFNTTGTAIA